MTGNTSAEDTKAKRKKQGERLNRIMWAYITGAITLLSYLVGFEPTYIPLGFGLLGLLLCWQLFRVGDQRHGVFAGILSLAGIMIWLFYNWAMIRHLFGR